MFVTGFDIAATEGCVTDEAVVVVAPAVVTILLIECDTAGLNCEAEELMMAAEEVAGDGDDGGGAKGVGKYDDD